LGGNHFGYYHSHNDGTNLTIEGRSNIDPKTWHHVAFIRDDVTKKVTLFVDGLESGSDFYTDKTLSNFEITGNRLIGHSEGRGEDYTNGNIALVKMYNYALKNTDIRDSYLASKDQFKCLPTPAPTPEPTPEPTPVVNDYINIILTPQLPTIEEKFEENTVYSFPDSTISFEFELPDNKILESEGIESISIKTSDTEGTNTEFKVFPTDIRGRNILALVIPGDIKAGSYDFNLNIIDGSTYKGKLKILDFPDVKVFNNENDNLRKHKPKIKAIFIKKRDKNIVLTLRGKSFINNRLKAARKDRNNTDQPKLRTITVFPSDLYTSINESVVKNGNKAIKVKILLNKDVTIKSHGFIVLATPYGIETKKFVINPGKDDKLLRSK